MSAKKIITVFGATGSQGGGLVRAIANDPDSEFTVRAVTRDPDSEKAKELSKLGAEVIYGDLSNEESIYKALEGAYGAYFVTFFWAHFSPEQEKAEAALFAKAAKQVGIKHAIWSTLEDTRELVPLHDNRMPTLRDIYKVPHFDAKGESNKVFKEAGVPTTFFHVSFYWDNFIYFGSGPKRDALSKALGEPVVYNKISADVYRSFGFPGADDLGNMFQIYDEFEEKLNNLRDINVSKQLNPDLMNFEQWLSRYAKKIPLD